MNARFTERPRQGGVVLLANIDGNHGLDTQTDTKQDKGDISK